MKGSGVRVPVSAQKERKIQTDYQVFILSFFYFKANRLNLKKRFLSNTGHKCLLKACCVFLIESYGYSKTNYTPKSRPERRKTQNQNCRRPQTSDSLHYYESDYRLPEPFQRRSSIQASRCFSSRHENKEIL